MKNPNYHSTRVENLYLGHGAALRVSAHNAGVRTGSGILGVKSRAKEQ